MTARADLRADAVRNRNRLLEVARARLESGDSELAMHVIAREAGVGVGTLYRHFPTHTALVEALAAETFGRIVRDAQVAATQPSAAEALRQLLSAGLDGLARDPSVALVLEGPEVVCMETTEMLAGLADAVTTVVSRARKAGLLRPDVGPDELRRIMLGIHHALRLPGASATLRDTMMSVFLHGLRQPTGADSRSRENAR